MTRRELEGLVYLWEAAPLLHVTFHALEKMLYHRALRAQLTRTYRKRWGHPRRIRMLTAADMQLLARFIIDHSHTFAPLRAMRPRRRRAKEGANVQAVSL